MIVWTNPDSGNIHINTDDGEPIAVLPKVLQQRLKTARINTIIKQTDPETIKSFLTSDAASEFIVRRGR